MDNLPQELVDLIVDQLYFESSNSLHWRQALTRYFMSSSRLRAACLRWLFRSASVTHDLIHRDLESFRDLIASSPRLVTLTQELEVHHDNSTQLSLLQQVLSSLPRLQYLLLNDVSLLGVPIAVKPIPLRSLSLRYLTAKSDITLNTLLGLFPRIEHFTFYLRRNLILAATTRGPVFSSSSCRCRWLR